VDFCLRIEGETVMKTLIVFASKYGGTRVSAGKIAKVMGEAELCELDKDSLPDLNQFDCIIAGGPLFGGSIHKSVAAFLKENTEVLLTKKIGLFIAGFEQSEREEPFTANFPESLLKHAAAKESIGGIFDPKTLNFFLKLLMSAITKSSRYKSTVSDEKIKRLTDALKVDVKN
jgi:menaquinone-dependent protoporphyrinogen oxidase